MYGALVPGLPGKVVFHGEVWNATSDEPVEKGGTVEVLAVEGRLARDDDAVGNVEDHLLAGTEGQVADPAGIGDGRRRLSCHRWLASRSPNGKGSCRRQ